MRQNDMQAIVVGGREEIWDSKSMQIALTEAIWTSPLEIQANSQDC